MIDMTFLLLIFFMVTASFHLQKGFHFPPDRPEDPKSVDQPVPGLSAFRDRVMLWVHADDSIHLDDGQGQPQTAAIPPADLVNQLRQVSQGPGGRNKLLVLPHETASHEALVRVVDSAVQAGLTEVALADIVNQAAAGSPPTTTPPRIIRPNAPRTP